MVVIQSDPPPPVCLMKSLLTRPQGPAPTDGPTDPPTDASSPAPQLKFRRGNGVYVGQEVVFLGWWVSEY